MSEISFILKNYALTTSPIFEIILRLAGYFANMKRDTRNLLQQTKDVKKVLNQVILKVVQHCNLNCTYCYVYNRGDDSWKSRPPFILENVSLKLAQRIKEHCERHNLNTFTVELHGGEPLLLSQRRMQSLIDTLRTNCSDIRLRIILQTNGLLLNDKWLKLLDLNNITFGISLDGPPEIADQNRVLRKGGGSTQKLLDTIKILREENSLFDKLFGGFLCVVNTEASGNEMVDWFVENGFSAFDFLLPDGNYSNLPQDWKGAGAYKEFLISAFDRWYSLGSKAPQIRKFETMMMGLMGGEILLDSLGGDLCQICVVESDGSIGVNDVSRICGGDFSVDILNIFDHSLDEHAERYNINEIQTPCDTCLNCPYLSSCGGGYLPHRFNGLDFNNTSIYCDALYALSKRMVDVIRRDIPSQVWDKVITN